MSRTAIAALAVAAWCASALPAAAQFYSLEGRFECLDDPTAVCGDTAPQMPAPKPRPKQTATAETTPAPAHAGALRARRTNTSPAPTGEAERADPLRAIAQRLAAGQAAPEDAAALRRLAEAGNTHALELLAWCSLKGVGVARDPVQAFLLYGLAADLGVAQAQRNQAIIYETELTSEQRQQVLMVANGAKPAR